MPTLTHIAIAAALAAAIIRPAAAMPDPLDIEPASTAQQWRMPLDGGRVSSFFGAVRGRRAHGGIDFSVPSGTPVMATDDGKVIASTNRYLGDRKYGNVVVIEHDNGLRSLYAHLNKRNVNVGDAVAAGETIGLSGATGRATGPHLHLEAFRDQARIDPNDLLLASLEDSALPSAMKVKRLAADEIVTTKASGGKSRKATKAGGRAKRQDAVRVAAKGKKPKAAAKPSKPRKRA